MNPLWGIDLGGTKIEGAVLEGPDSSNCVCRLRIPTEAQLGYDHIVGQIQKMVGMLEEASSMTCESIGIGTPGAFDPATGAMKNCNTTCLNGRPLPADLEKLLSRRVAVANDANCFALAEAKMGAGRGAGVVFGVILGTGVGGGVVVHGHVLNGAQGIAGEWGHNILEPDGELCYCGKRGCNETVLAGPALERWYAKQSGKKLGLKSIVSAARERTDPVARQTLDRMCEKFGQAIAVVINILDPDVIVLGGGVGNTDELYTVGVDKIQPWVFNPEVRNKIVRPMLGDSAGVFGAAHLLVDGESW